MRELGEALANPAEPEDEERAVGEVVRCAGDVRGFPFAEAQVALGVREAPEGGDEEVEGGGGCRVVDGAGGV